MAELVGPRLYSCSNCRNHVSLHDDIISKAFHKGKMEKSQGDFRRGKKPKIVFRIEVTYRKYVDQSTMRLDSLKANSKAKHGKNGRAFLFSHAMNIVTGPKEDRHLLTGLHTVADVYCGDCREVLGWKYERAYEASQKYKEGKFILEKSKIIKENW